VFFIYTIEIEYYRKKERCHSAPAYRQSSLDAESLLTIEIPAFVGMTGFGDDRLGVNTKSTERSVQTCAANIMQISDLN